MTRVLTALVVGFSIGLVASVILYPPRVIVSEDTHYPATPVDYSRFRCT